MIDSAVEAKEVEKPETIEVFTTGYSVPDVGKFIGFHLNWDRYPSEIGRGEEARVDSGSERTKVNYPIYERTDVPTHIISRVLEDSSPDGYMWKVQAEKISPADWDFYLAQSGGIAGGGYQVYVRDQMTGQLKGFTDYEGTHWAGDNSVTELGGLTYEEACEKVRGMNSNQEYQPDTHIPTYSFRPMYLKELARMMELTEEQEDGGRFVSGLNEKEILGKVLASLGSSKSGSELRKIPQL